MSNCNSISLLSQDKRVAQVAGASPGPVCPRTCSIRHRGRCPICCSRRGVQRRGPRYRDAAHQRALWAACALALRGEPMDLARIRRLLEPCRSTRHGHGWAAQHRNIAPTPFRTPTRSSRITWLTKL